MISRAEHNPVAGVLWMLVSAACFACMSSAIRPASEELHPFQVLFFRNVVGTAVMLPWLLRSGIASLRVQRLPLHGLRSLLILTSMMSWFFVLNHVTMVDAVSLSFTAPLFSTLLAALVLHEVVRWRRWAAILTGFIGALIILRPEATNANPMRLLVLLNSVTWAAAVVVTKVLTRTESPQAIVAYMFLLLLFLSAIPAAFVWRDVPASALPWLLLVGLGGAGGHYFAAKAISMASTSLVMPIEYVRLPILGLAGFLFWAEVPDVWNLVGSAVIVAAALYVGHREARAEAGELAAEKAA
jgi:drug/metabolite transporter (DMT)-like permease